MPIAGDLAGFSYQFANNLAGMKRNKMPVTKQHAGRVVAAPARCKRYNIPDSELKGLGLASSPQDKTGAAGGALNRQSKLSPGVFWRL